MNEIINLCEILKDCPKGTVFYSPIFGNVSFERLVENGTEIMVITDRGTDELIHSDATASFWGTTSVEPMLFPDREQRDWSKWQCPKPKKPKFDPKTLKPFDKVLARLDDQSVWCCELFSCFIENANLIRCCGEAYYKHCIPYNDDTKHLVGTSDEAPEFYRYWEE